MSNRVYAPPLDSEELLENVALGICACSAVIFIVLQFVQKAPYGRYTPQNFKGVLVNWQLANVLKHIPAVPAAMLALYWSDVKIMRNPANFALIGIFFIHYMNRSLVYPCASKGKGAPTPLSVVGAAGLYCGVSGFLQCRYLSRYAAYPSDYYAEPRFVAGVALWATGFLLNRQSDRILAALRRPGQSGYFIPHGGLFRFVSGANFLAEIIEWSGFTLAAWQLPALSHLCFTLSNLVPRALQHHQWYLDKFRGEYPASRKALIPFLL